MPRTTRDGRRKLRMGEALDRRPPAPPSDADAATVDGDWRAALATDRAAGRRSLERGGWNKGERKGYGVASGRSEPPDEAPVFASEPVD